MYLPEWNNNELLQVVRRQYPSMLNERIEDTLDKDSPHYETKLLLHNCNCDNCALRSPSRDVFKTHCPKSRKRPKRNICVSYISYPNLPKVEPLSASSDTNWYINLVYGSEDNKRSS